MKKIIIFLIFLCTVNFSQEKPVFVTPEWAFNKTIYEVNLRQFTPEGTIKAFIPYLDTLKDLGAELLWFMPIHPIGELNRKGSLGSYYSIRDFKDVDPFLGSKEDFKELVRIAHSKGMFVIIDWVANHSSWDNYLVKTNPEFYETDENGNFMPPVEDWSDVISFNYEVPQMKDYMWGALEYWVKEFNIDGYRCDVAGMVPLDFWIEARKRLDQIKPVFMLAEWESAEMHLAFDMTYAWGFHHLLNKFVQGEATVTDFINEFDKDFNEYPQEAIRMRFTSNHDENSWNGTEFERLGDFAEIFAVFCAVTPGMNLIYSGQEAGNQKRLLFFDKDLIEWQEHKMRGVYTTLTNLRKGEKALNAGNDKSTFNVIVKGEDYLLFERKKDESSVLCFFNFSNSDKVISIQELNLSGTFVDVFSGMSIQIDRLTEISLPALNYFILRKKG